MPLWASHSAGLSVGSTVTLAVRAEALRISGEHPDVGSLNQLAGEIVEVLYEGGGGRYVIQTPTGERLVARRVSAHETQVEEILRGSRAFVSWEPTQTLVFPPSIGLVNDGIPQ
jgi:hypothetical protein